MAERAIQTFKNHFIAILAGTDPAFPLHLWDKLIPQAETTLNLLRQSRQHPQLSAHTHLFGPFDYNRTPLAPLGTKAIVHDKPQQRGTWAVHGAAGWYIGYAPEHYQCYHVYVTATRGTRVSDTVEFFPHARPMPRTSLADAAQFSARELIAALRNPVPAGPFTPIGDRQLVALQQLADIFQTTVQQARKSKSPAPSEPASPPPPAPPPSQTEPHVPPQRVAHKPPNQRLTPHRYPTRLK
jgi:hypothetical protein